VTCRGRSLAERVDGARSARLRCALRMRVGEVAYGTVGGVFSPLYACSPEK
jgi:hypothetical protein